MLPARNDVAHFQIRHSELYIRRGPFVDALGPSGAVVSCVGGVVCCTPPSLDAILEKRRVASHVIAGAKQAANPPLEKMGTKMPLTSDDVATSVLSANTL